MFWSINKKNVYPCKPQFYYIEVGCKGVFVTRTCFGDGLYALTKPPLESDIVLVLGSPPKTDRSNAVILILFLHCNI